MNARLYLPGASGNPLIQVASLLVFGVALIGAVLMGAVILAFLFGLAVIGAIVFSVRLWWMRRKLQKQGSGQQTHRHSHRSATEGRLIEAEYTVVRERELNRSRHD